ncbi:hypothetical protein [Roseibium sp. MMSF_3412]|uniref:hypothetical protein n=1 Tax=Roseibium sp. MMSF_3412 TaxID=3046712 RepID=UPI00273FFB15|nr:hypothetical protein [Roseibium sp. MMSF_3412]
MILGVLGSPELELDIWVSETGIVSIAGVQTISVDGLDADGLLNASRDIVARLFSHGTNVADVVSPSQIVLKSVEYRPVYILGDVIEGGQIDYNPGMTPRMSIAVAKGLAETPGQRLASNYDIALQERAYKRALLDGYRAELKIESLSKRLQGTTTGLVPLPPLPEKPASEAVLANLRDLETQRRKTAELAIASEEEASERLLRLIRSRRTVLETRLKNEQELLKLVADRLKLLEKTLTDGLTTARRIDDIRRDYYDAKSSVLVLEAELAALEIREHDERTRLETAIAERQDRWRRELQDAISEREEAGVLIESFLDQNMSSVDELEKLEITVSRSCDGEIVNLPISIDDELWPGDIVTISLEPISSVSQAFYQTNQSLDKK